MTLNCAWEIAYGRVPMLDATNYDLIIIGAGPAGMSAAVYAAKQKLKFIVICKNIGGLANYIEEIKTQPGIPYISGFGLVKSVQEQLQNYKVNIVEDEEVKSLRASGRSFIVSTKVSEYTGKSVIVATGRRFKSAGIKGDTKLAGKGVSFCAVCDGESFEDGTVAVIGGGHSGLFAALSLLKIARKIYIIEKKPDIERAGKVRSVSKAVSASPNVTILINAKA